MKNGGDSIIVSSDGSERSCTTRIQGVFYEEDWFGFGCFGFGIGYSEC